MNALIKDQAGRGRPWRRLSPVFAAVAALLLVAAGAGAAATPQQPAPPIGLPQPSDPFKAGTEFRLAGTLEGFNVIVNQSSVTTSRSIEQPMVIGIPELQGGLTFVVEKPDPLDPLATPLKITEFSLTNEHSAGSDAPAGAEQARQPQDVGVVNMTMTDTSDIPDSVLKQAAQSPPRWEQTMFLDFTMSIESPPMQRSEGPGTEQSGPLVLRTKEPAQLSAQLSKFPPDGDTYKLQNPIQLVLPDNPDQAVASIDKFPINVGGL